MGVPKFYKWLSERYPLINQLANSDIKPEFDNMYLDMNGIIHNCTHSDVPEEGSGGKALSDEQMFTNIFKYLEKLFNIARPRKLLYMAIDGVAPRAKMNQQRQRRFRAAKDAREHLDDMRRRGEDVDPNAVFDSNCITPGTSFMVSLSGHIRYFIRKKMKEDAAWRGVRVIFSGAEVPGEGEHKIMLYIRNSKSQPGYDPNLRHVLYGLDADLVMLSLVSHEPHFSLLREEVIFGNAARMPRKILKRNDQFQFLHISLLREYIDLEFGTVFRGGQQAPAITDGSSSSPAASADAASSSSSSSSSSGAPAALAAPQAGLPFEYSLERVIDDWVILAFFVGNDFLPHLPTLDIGEGGLDTLFQIYKEELPRMDGYIFERKQINWKRLERITQRMGELEEQVFAERQEAAIEFARKARKRERREQAAVIEVQEDELFDGEMASPSPDPDLAAGIAASLEEAERAHKAALELAAAAPVAKVFDSQLSMLIRSSDARIEVDETTGEPLDYESLTFKARYYREKFPEMFDRGARLLRQHSGTALEEGSAANIRKLVQNYAQGLKWVASYYYEGCRSWKWYFAYRYAPLASDLVDLDQLDLTLQLGYPFRPLEQLLGVLPAASGKLLPPAYRALMDPRTSPVADFYPLDFSIDMNGKRAAWEGIALIPFIDESRLLRAINNIPPQSLSESERVRNARYGDEYVIEYDEDNKATLPATLPFFPSIPDCHSRESIWHVPAIPMTEDEKAERATYEAETAVAAQSDPTVLPVPAHYSGNFEPALCSGVKFPTEGYPSLVESVRSNGGVISASLQKIAVNVFGMESRKDSLVVKVEKSKQHQQQAAAALAHRYVGKRVFADWPYLKDALLVRICDATHVYTAQGVRPQPQNDAALFRTDCMIAQQKLLTTRAVDIGSVQLMCAVQLFVGMRRTPSGAIKRAFSDEETLVPWQLIFPTLSNPDPRYRELPPPSLADAFPLNTTVVYTGATAQYGSMGRIVSHEPGGKTVAVAVTVGPPEAQFGRAIATSSQLQFYPSYLVSKSLGIHPLVLSKICSSVYVQQERTDIGLKIKFAKQALQVPEYARRVEAWSATGKMGPVGDAARRNNNESGQAPLPSNEGWEYSERAVALLAAYKRRFPLLFEMMNEEPNTFKYDGERLIQASPADKNASPNSSAAAAGGSVSPLTSKTASDAIHEIDTWLKTVGINNLILVPCGSKVMAERGIKAVETEASRLQKLREQQPTREIVLKNVPIFHLYRPDPTVAWSPTEMEAPELGDRVLSLRSDLGAPIGLRGTVVCVHESKHVEVVFDREFMSGTHLHHKCSNMRGQTLPFTAVLNLSKPKVLTPKNVVEEPVVVEAKEQPHQKQTSPQKQPKQPKAAAAPAATTAPVAAAATAAPLQHGSVQILRRPAPAAAPAAAIVAPAAPAAAAAAAPSTDVDAASAQLKQMLNIGGPAAAAAAPMPMAAAAPAAPAQEAAEESAEDAMQRLLNKGKARKSKPAGSGVPPQPFQPLAYAPTLVGPYGAVGPHPVTMPPHMPMPMPPHGGYMQQPPPPPFMQGNMPPQFMQQQPHPQQQPLLPFPGPHPPPVQSPRQ